MTDPATTNGKHASDTDGQSVPSPNGDEATAGLPPAPGAGGNSGRDSRGRFAKGNPGRPPRHRKGAPSLNGLNGPTASAPAPATPGRKGRTADGRFARGNPGGPGNPFARRLAALRYALLHIVSEEDIRRIAEHLRQQALDGDLIAVKILFLYTLGKPAEVVDPDTLDWREWQMYQQTLVRPDDVTAMLQRLPPDIVVLLVRFVLPCLGETFRRQFLAQFGNVAPGAAEAGGVAEASMPGGSSGSSQQ
jgi:hypothetical protein